MGALIATHMGPQHMTIHTDTLTLAQWFSPSFPVGAFAYSHGLETAVSDGTICDTPTLLDWLSDLIQYGSGRADAVLIACAYDAADPAAIDEAARAFAASAERLQETTLQGAAFAGTLNATEGLTLPPLTYPVAVGAAACANGLDKRLTLSMYLHAFVANLTSAAIRLVPLGQTQGQEVQTALKPVCFEMAEAVQNATLTALYSNTFASDIAAMRHEVQSPRLFRT